MMKELVFRECEDHSIRYPKESECPKCKSIRKKFIFVLKQLIKKEEEPGKVLMSCTTLHYVMDQLKTDPEFTIGEAQIAIAAYYLMSGRMNSGELGRQLFSVEPMGPGAQAAYNFDALIFILPKDNKADK